MTKTVAEQALDEIEIHHRAEADAKHKLDMALRHGTEDEQKAATDAHAKAQRERLLTGHTSRHRDAASQAVLDERGHGHTETRVLPDDLAEPLKAANRAVLLASAGGDGPEKEAALAARDQAEKDYAAAVAAHAKGA